MHRFLIDEPLAQPGHVMAITGDEAVHAVRVKRIEAGELVEVMDGRGSIAFGKVAGVGRASKARDRAGAGQVVEVLVEAVKTVDPARPVLEVWSATPKGGRLDDMIDTLSQVGVAEWCALETERSVVDPREAKLARLDRIIRESGKQCGRAWLMRIGPKRRFAEAIRAEAGVRIVLASASAEAIQTESPPTARIRLLIGPEGGWTNAELAATSSASVPVHRFGVHTMRIETAAAAAAAIVMNCGVRS